MATKIQLIPDGPRAVTPYLTVNGAAKAIEFYKQAFGAVETVRWTGTDERIGHAEITISGTPLMISDEYPEMDVRGPKSLGGSAVGLYLYVEDADATFSRAIGAGATQVQAVEVQPHGVRSGIVKDPFGHRWFIATRIADVPAADLEKAALEGGFRVTTPRSQG